MWVCYMGQKRASGKKCVLDPWTPYFDYGYAIRAQKIATPRVGGSNLGSSKFFGDHHFSGKTERHEDDDPSARKIRATMRRSRENEK